MIRIAAVEDDSLMQKMLAAALETEGFALSVFPDGKSALERLPDLKPDFVLLDVNLPDMTGHDVCRALKADARTRAIPVLMLTGEAREVESRVAGLDAGADDYLFKPVSPRVLVARIRALLGAGR